MGCCKGLFNKGKRKNQKLNRGASLPPVQSKQELNKQDDQYKSLPSLAKDIEIQDDYSHSRSSEKNSSEIGHHLIIPAPKSFQEASDENITSSETSETVSKILQSNQRDIEQLYSARSSHNSLKKSARDESMNQSKLGKSIHSQHSVKFVDENDDEQLMSRPRDIENDFDETADSSYNKSVQLNLSYHENSANYSNNVVVNTNTIQKLVETYNADKNLIRQLRMENENYRMVIENFHQQALEKESQKKEENDTMIKRIQDMLGKELKTEAEKEALKNFFLSRQQEVSERMIIEQNNIIETLQNKCNHYENDLKNVGYSDEINQRNVDDLNDEVVALRDIIHHLNIELSSYQAKYPSNSLISSKLLSLPNRSPKPIWLVSTKFLSPLIAVYDERIKEKDEKLKLFKNKIDDLTRKFGMILDENNQLHLKCEKISSGGKAFDSNDLNELNEIRHHAMLVLEENQVLRENVDTLHKRILHLQKSHIQEIGELSKKAIISESEKTDLQNQIETLKFSNEDILRKYNDIYAEVQRRVTLHEHVKQIGELNAKLEEAHLLHKHELEGITNKLKNLHVEKKELALKYSQVVSDNKKLYAENKVLDKALNEGIGRKTQRKLQKLEKRLEISELNNRSSRSDLEQIAKEAEKLRIEKEALENLAKSNELEKKKNQNRRLEENLQIVKLEDKFQSYKEKSSKKMEAVLKKVKRKESDFFLNKLESEKKISDILNLMHKKEDQLEIYLKEKRQLESEIEFVWQATSAENRNLKDSLLANRSMTASQHRLLLDDY